MIVHRKIIVTATTALALSTLSGFVADGAAASEVRARFVDSCRQREAVGPFAVASGPWIELFCHREADLRYAHFAVAPEAEQRALLGEACVVRELLSVWRKSGESAVYLAALRRTVAETCAIDVATLMGDVPAAQRAEQTLIIEREALKNFAADAEIGRSADAAVRTRP